MVTCESLDGGFIFFNFHPYLGKIPILTNIFHMGWNHQIDPLFEVGWMLRFAKKGLEVKTKHTQFIQLIHKLRDSQIILKFFCWPHFVLNSYMLKCFLIPQKTTGLPKIINHMELLKRKFLRNLAIWGRQLRFFSEIGASNQFQRYFAASSSCWNFPISRPPKWLIFYEQKHRSVRTHSLFAERLDLPGGCGLALHLLCGVQTLSTEIPLEWIESDQLHWRLPSSGIFHHEYYILGTNDVLQTSQWPT